MYSNYYLRFDEWIDKNVIDKWMDWWKVCDDWCIERVKQVPHQQIVKECNVLRNFFKFYIAEKPCGSSIDNFFYGIDSWEANLADLRMVWGESCTKYFYKINNDIIIIAKFIEYVIELKKIEIINPFIDVFATKISTIEDCIELLRNNIEDWSFFIRTWVENEKIKENNDFKLFLIFLRKNKEFYEIDAFFSNKNVNGKDRLISFLQNFLKTKTIQIYKVIVSFCDYVFINKYKVSRIEKINPFFDITNKNFDWIVDFKGVQWTKWRDLADNWFNNYSLNEKNTDKRSAIKYFLLMIVEANVSSDPKDIFNKENSRLISNENYKFYLSNNGIKNEIVTRRLNRILRLFFNFVVSSEGEVSRKQEYNLVLHKKMTLDLSKFEDDNKLWFDYFDLYLIEIRENKQKNIIVRAIKIFYNFIFHDIEGGVEINVVLKDELIKEKYEKYLFKNGYSINVVKAFVRYVRDFIEFILKEKNLISFKNNFLVEKEKESLHVFDKFVNENGEEWREWCSYAKEWINNNGDYYKRTYIKETAIFCFLKYLLKEELNEPIVINFLKLPIMDNNYEKLLRKSIISKEGNTKNVGVIYQSIRIFVTWVLIEKYKKEFNKGITSPIGMKVKHIGNIYDDTRLKWVDDLYGPFWNQWKNYILLWFESDIKITEKQLYMVRNLFENYLINYPEFGCVINFFLKNNGKNINSLLVSHFNFSAGIKKTIVIINFVHKLFDFIIKNVIQELNSKGIKNPVSASNITTKGKTLDIELKWFVYDYGEIYSQWREFSYNWLKIQVSNIAKKLRSIIIFLEGYIIKFGEMFSNVEDFFKGNELVNNDDFILAIKDYSDISDFSETISVIVDFLDWIVINNFYYKNSFGTEIPLYKNPIKKIKFDRIRHTESIYNALPYQYISKLKNILCPQLRGNFSDWIWAYTECDIKLFSSVWFEVDEDQIDKHDPDCVWIQSSDKFYIWSPVAAVVIWVKLNLPLRTFQVRMLDSGEADEWRYEKEKFIKNKNAICLKNRNMGVFRRQYDYDLESFLTSIYVNTNKTADIYKDEKEKGYIIPWNNLDVLYWLEKLRNWQEKYNPISKITDCRDLEVKHMERLISEYQLNRLGKICFLFRNPSVDLKVDRDKPITEYSINRVWYFLLEKLEKDLKKQNNNIFKEKNVTFIKSRSKTSTYFPLHCLRVSLITIYQEYSGLPLPFISKFIAGHSRLIMTLHYTKPSNSKITQKLNEAYETANKNNDEDVCFFLRDLELDQIEKSTVYNDFNSVKDVLQTRNSLAWEPRYHGVCLAGGNSFNTINAEKKLIGCWNGGNAIINDETGKIKNYMPVPHHYENCVRCRWFVTDIRYLNQLVSHFNFLSYKTHTCAELVRQTDEKITLIEEKMYSDNKIDLSFIEKKELDSLYKIKKHQLLEMDEYANDSFSTLFIIKKLLDIEKSKKNSKLNIVALGSTEDMQLAFEETENELLQLLLLCNDANIYPELKNELIKTPAIEKLIIYFSKSLIKKGKHPYLLYLDRDEQLLAINSLIENFETQKLLNEDRILNFKDILGLFDVENTDNDKTISLLNILDLKREL